VRQHCEPIGRVKEAALFSLRARSMADDLSSSARWFLARPIARGGNDLRPIIEFGLILGIRARVVSLSLSFCERVASVVAARSQGIAKTMLKRTKQS
jgi:hypothetical protein